MNNFLTCKNSVYYACALLMVYIFELILKGHDIFLKGHDIFLMGHDIFLMGRDIFLKKNTAVQYESEDE